MIGLVTFLVAFDKVPDKKQLQEGKVYLGLKGGLRDTAHHGRHGHGRQGSRRADEAAGHMSSTVRKQMAMTAGLSSLFSLSPAGGTVPPAFRGVLPTQLNLSRNDFASMPWGCLLTSSKYSQTVSEG